jgi:hypothetical protein
VFRARGDFTDLMGRVVDATSIGHPYYLSREAVARDNSPGLFHL